MAAHTFDGASCLSQLQCSGMTDVLALMEQGYPSRTQFSDLYDLYKSKLPTSLSKLDPRVFCKLLFQALGLHSDDFKFGISRVFFRPGKFAEFDQMLRADPEHLAQLVAKVAVWLLRYRWHLVQYCAWEVIKLTKKIHWRRMMVIRVQKHIRGWLCRKRIGPAIRAMLEMTRLRRQLDSCKQAYMNMPKHKAEGLAEVDGFLRQLDQTRNDLRGKRLVQPGEIQTRLEKLRVAVDLATVNMRKRAELEESAREAAAKAAAEMERTKAEREQLAKQQAEDEKQRKAHQELEKRRRESELATSAKTSDMRRVAAEREQQAQLEAQAAVQAEWDKRDRDLASRIAGGDMSAIDDSSSSVVGSKHGGPPGPYDYLRAWPYAKLRETINHSCDVCLLEACRNEFHRRIQVYQQWKNRQKKEKTEPVMRVPKEIIDFANEKGILIEAVTQDQKSPGEVRCFHMTFPCEVNPAIMGTWYVEFEGRYVSRQMEVYPKESGRPPVLRVSGAHDMHMCELPLEQTGLQLRKGAEFTLDEFEIVWGMYGGNEVLARHAANLGSTRLRERVPAGAASHGPTLRGPAARRAVH